MVSQYNYNNSDAMTDYFNVNFYGGRLEIDWDFKVERKEQELNSVKNDIQQHQDTATMKAVENENDDMPTTELDLHLETLRKITNEEMDFKLAADEIQKVSIYLQENDLVDEYEGALDEAANAITKMMQTAFAAASQS